MSGRPSAEDRSISPPMQDSISPPLTTDQAKRSWFSFRLPFTVAPLMAYVFPEIPNLIRLVIGQTLIYWSLITFTPLSVDKSQPSSALQSAHGSILSVPGLSPGSVRARKASPIPARKLFTMSSRRGRYPRNLRTAAEVVSWSRMAIPMSL